MKCSYPGLSFKVENIAINPHSTVLFLGSLVAPEIIARVILYT